MARLVDLTLAIGPGTPGPPSVPTRLELEHFHRGPGFWQSSRVSMLLHTGSHVDFSKHCQADGETAADVALDRTWGDAVLVDVGELEPSQPITVELLERHAPEIRPGDITLVRTGWSDRMWGDFPAYFLTSPYCSAEAVRWLAATGAKAVGFDCFSEYSARLPDFGSEDFVVHKTVLDAGAVLMQQLTNLDALPRGERFEFFAAFPKLREAEGVPARFFARLTDR